MPRPRTKPDTCTVCARPADVPGAARGLCPGHYQLARRGEAMRPLGTAKGQGDRVGIRVPKPLREEAMADALSRGMSEGQWWREAGEEKLRRKVTVLRVR